METWKLAAIEQTVKEQYQSPTSTVHLVAIQGARLGVVKQRKGEGFLKELCIHRFLSKAAPSHFPYLHDSSVQTQSMLLEMSDRLSAADQIQSEGAKSLPNSPAEALGFTLHVVTGVEFMHRRGIVHGNIHPRHVLLSSECRPKITSFIKSRFYTTNLPSLFHQDIVQLGHTLLCILNRDLHATLPLSPNCYSAQIHSVLSLMLDSGRPPTASQLVSMLLDQSYTGLTIELSMVGGRSGEGLLTLMEESGREGGRGVVGCEDSWEVPESFGEGERGDGGRMELAAGMLAAISQQHPFPEEEISQLFEFLQSLRRASAVNFTVSVTSIAASLCGACHFRRLNSCLVVLGCEHCFCVPCFNSSLQCTDPSHLFSTISCWVCNTPFNPFSYSPSLSPEVRDFLTVLDLREQTHPCPSCRQGLDIEDSAQSNPTSVTCPTCKHKFCSYCDHSSHYFGCSKYSRDRRLAAQKK